MPRPEKVQAVATIKERIENAQAVFLAEYAGLSVKQQQQLRRRLREEGAEFKVVKMTLARRAVAELDIDTLDELLLGPTGLTFADGDPVSAAKALKDFAKDHEVVAIKGGLLGSEFLTPERISELAEIEPRDVLLAKVAGLFKAPMANMAGLLAAMPRNMASMMQQLLERKESEAPAAEVVEELEAVAVAAEEAVAEAVVEEAVVEEAVVEEAVVEEAVVEEAVVEEAVVEEAVVEEAVVEEAVAEAVAVEAEGAVEEAIDVAEEAIDVAEEAEAAGEADVEAADVASAEEPAADDDDDTDQPDGAETPSDDDAKASDEAEEE
jgi:large subunit ribosomal protein L10